ncbi:hypothetical protein F4777DRAFT_581973 [Nemania sp. FL0916]|nr:hypothetical protein F4777DRAFT_581973 [Nemania sp. FL0916]
MPKSQEKLDRFKRSKFLSLFQGANPEEHDIKVIDAQNGIGTLPQPTRLSSSLSNQDKDVIAVPSENNTVGSKNSNISPGASPKIINEAGETIPRHTDDPVLGDDDDNRVSIREEDHEQSPVRSPRDLWQEAWESDDVGDERRALLESKWEDQGIDNSMGHPKSLLTSVVKLTEYKFATYKKRWGTEDNQTVSGKVKSIMISALTVKDVVDAGLKLEPTKGGLAAWAVVCFGLKLVQNDKENWDLTFDSCRYLSGLLARYTRIEQLYWKRNVDGNADLEATLINIYVAILRYSAEVKESAQSSLIHRTRRSMIALTGQPLQKLKDRIEEEDDQVEKWQRVLDREEHDENMESMRTQVDKIVEDLEQTKTGMANIKEGVLDQELQGIFEWLFKEESAGSAGQRKTHDQLREAIREVAGGDYEAGKWLFQKAEYMDWKQYPQGLLWLHANSGSGKSSLCSTMIHNLESSFEKDDARVLMYWYFRFYIDETKRIDLLFRSLLRQLGSKCKDLPEDVLNRLRLYRRSGKQMDTEKLFDTLKVFISQVNKEVFIVLDGLDEFPEDSKEAKRPQLLKHIIALAQSGFSNLHLALVSKDEKDIRNTLEHNLQDILVPVEINSELNEDLNHFIKRKMATIKLLTPSLKDDINEKLKNEDEKGGGRNFLYATSLLKDVAECQSTSEIRETINKVPGSMAAIYEEALRKVKEEKEQLMKSILMWLMRQLHICTRALAEQCFQNVTVADDVEERRIMRFTHSSAKDYLDAVQLAPLGTHDQEIRRFVFSDKVDLIMTRRCLQILTVCTNVDADSEMRVELPLLQYAAEYWFQHYRLIDKDEKVSRS